MTLDLSALDGSNPRDFLATLGLLHVGPPSWKLSWEDTDAWRPKLHGVPDLGEVLDVVDADRVAFASRRTPTAS